MFFWTRSLLCIGTIVVLASGRSNEAIVPAASKLAGGALGAAATRFCEGVPDRCMALAKQGAETVSWRDAALHMLPHQTNVREPDAIPPHGHRDATSPAL